MKSGILDRNLPLESFLNEKNSFHEVSHAQLDGRSVLILSQERKQMLPCRLALDRTIRHVRVARQAVSD